MFNEDKLLSWSKIGKSWNPQTKEQEKEKEHI